MNYSFGRFIQVAVAATVVALSAQADAADIMQGCFERVYDKAHMAKHVGQVATAMQLQIGIAANMKGEQDGEEDQDLLAICGLDRKDLYYGGTSCRGTTDEASCTNAENAERFSVTRTKNGIKLNVLTRLTLTIEGTFDKTIIIPRDAENEVYALVKVSDSNCSYFNRKQSLLPIAPDWFDVRPSNFLQSSWIAPISAIRNRIQTLLRSPHDRHS